MANNVIPGGGFCHIALGAVKFEESIAFYSALGMKKVIAWGEAPNRAIMMDMGDGGVVEMFENSPCDEQNAPHWQHLAIATTDTDAAFKAALEAGATVKTNPQSLTIQGDDKSLPVRIAFVYGPNGEEIEFFQVCE